jgi:hypothetical protein
VRAREFRQHVTTGKGPSWVELFESAGVRFRSAAYELPSDVLETLAQPR